MKAEESPSKRQRVSLPMLAADETDDDDDLPLAPLPHVKRQRLNDLDLKSIESDDDDFLPLRSATSKVRPSDTTSKNNSACTTIFRRGEASSRKTMKTNEVHGDAPEKMSADAVPSAAVPSAAEVSSRPFIESQTLEDSCRAVNGFSHSPSTTRVKTDMHKKSELPPTASSIIKNGKLQVREENYEPIDCWWEKHPQSDGTQWSYLEHHGLIFTPAYDPHNIPVIYNDQTVQLPPQAEEVANYWCLAMESDYGKKEKFIKNFWHALIIKLPSEHPLKQAQFEEVDFSPIKDYLFKTRESIKERRKNFTKYEKEMEKAQKELEEGPYLYALHDWLREKVGTYKTEPPSLFRGRGEHPKMGQLKRRIFPDEVILNCHADAPVPRLSPEMIGHSWKDIFHDSTVSWLAFYRDSVNGMFKYTFLGVGSGVKGQKDHSKYEKARRLKDHIDAIRRDYSAKINSDDMVDRQLGTATYMLDVLALRVGNEKDSNEEADTVGCCSLRVEHISFHEENSTITLDFLGKDSIRYLNTVTVTRLVLKNLVNFCKNKDKEADIFDRINPGSLNKYLRDLMPGLSAKVFRTFNASHTLQLELDKLDPDVVDITNPEAIRHFFDSANRTVAILCNHQRSVPKQHETSMDKMQIQLNKLEEDRDEYKEYLRHLKSHHKKTSFHYQPKTKSKDQDDVPRVSLIKDGMREDVVEKKLMTLEKRIATHKIRMKMKDENKTVSNSTSKQHYMDPRITVAYCKKWELPIERLFNTVMTLFIE